MNRYVLLFISGCLLYSQAFSAIKTAVNNASNGWSVASNWFPAGVPANGDTVIIPVTFSLSVKGNIYNSTPPRLIIYVYGTLDFDPAGRIELADESEIYVFNGGSITTNGSSSERIIINGLTKFNGQSDGNISGPLFANGATGSSPSGFVTFSVLPAKLIQFSHELKSYRLQLNWTLVEENNSHHYELQRRKNNTSWEMIQTNTLGGIAGEIHSNFYTDNLLANGIYEYRLCFKTADGHSQYSKTICLKIEQLSNKLKLFPNPATSQLFFSTERPISSGQISISNASGKNVYQPVLFMRNNASIDISHLPKGMYTLLLKTGGEILSEIFIIR